MIFRFLRSASSISSSACAGVDVNGFSTKTCLPFSSAAFASSKWVQTGVTTATASMSGDCSTSEKSVVSWTPGYTRLRALERGRVLVADGDELRSCRGRARLRTMFGPQ